MSTHCLVPLRARRRPPCVTRSSKREQHRPAGSTVRHHQTREVDSATDTSTSMWPPARHILRRSLVGFRSICILDEYNVLQYYHRFRYCRVDRNGTGASDPRGGYARDFVNFREKNSCIPRARRGRARETVYPPRIQIRDVAARIARPDHRKSKFGLRHAIKLIELYGVTKSKF